MAFVDKVKVHLIFTINALRAIIKCILRAISCQFVAEHAMQASQLDAVAWDTEEERLRTTKRLLTANLARAVVHYARDNINQDSYARTL